MPRNVEHADAGAVEAGLSIRDQLQIQESDLRALIAKKITTAFIIVNLGVLLVVALVIAIDHGLIYSKLIQPNERLITTQLLMTIIGATTVQFGAIAYAMSSWLFPRKSG